MIRFSCPSGHRLKVADDMAGRQVRCARCKEVVVVPERSTRPPSKSSSPGSQTDTEPGSGPGLGEKPDKRPAASSPAPSKGAKPAKPASTTKPGKKTEEDVFADVMGEVVEARRKQPPADKSKTPVGNKSKKPPGNKTKSPWSDSVEDVFAEVFDEVFGPSDNESSAKPAAPDIRPRPNEKPPEKDSPGQTSNKKGDARPPTTATSKPPAPTASDVASDPGSEPPPLPAAGNERKPTPESPRPKPPPPRSKANRVSQGKDSAGSSGPPAVPKQGPPAAPKGRATTAGEERPEAKKRRRPADRRPAAPADTGGETKPSDGKPEDARGLESRRARRDRRRSRRKLRAEQETSSKDAEAPATAPQPAAVKEPKQRRARRRRAPRGPRVMPIDTYQADPSKRIAVRWLALWLGLAVAFSVLPLFSGGYLNPAVAPLWPWWARLVLLVAVLQATYIAWMLGSPDWASVWVVMIVFTGVAMLYGMTTAVVVASPPHRPMPLDLGEVRHAARAWCSSVLLVMALATYLAGRTASRWRRAFELEIAARLRRH
jgi:hypothetical protein